jgi:single-strand DNA-binding protein
MAGYQRVIICGNVGKDPEIKSFDWGKVANFSIATSETWKDKATGEKKERTEWHRISVKGNDRLIDNVISQYVRKGSVVLIEGQLQTRKYEKDGVDHYTTEIVIGAFNGSLTLMGGNKKDSGAGRNAADDAPATTGEGDAPETFVQKPAKLQSSFDEEIPF